MIETILGNKTNIRVLRLLYQYPAKEFLISEILKYAQSGKKNTYDSITLLHNLNLIEKNKKKYRLNHNNPLTENIKNLFEKERNQYPFSKSRRYKEISDFLILINKFFKDRISEVILFGSVALGTDSEDSDIDIAIILKNKEKTDEIKFKRTISESQLKLFQTFFYDKKEYENMKSNKNTSTNQIEQTGKIIMLTN